MAKILMLFLVLIRFLCLGPRSLAHVYHQTSLVMAKLLRQALAGVELDETHMQTPHSCTVLGTLKLTGQWLPLTPIRVFLDNLSRLYSLHPLITPPLVFTRLVMTSIFRRVINTLHPWTGEIPLPTLRSTPCLLHPRPGTAEIPFDILHTRAMLHTQLVDCHQTLEDLCH